MAAGQEVLFEVSVRDSAGHNQIIQVTATTTVSDIKRQFSQKTGLAQQSYQLVFAGRSLNDSDTLQTLGVQSHSTLFCIMGQVSVEARPNIREVEDKLGTLTTADGPVSTDSNTRFYVYCKSVCKDMKPGKLRVRCSSCKDERFTLSSEPQGWSDVLVKQKLKGECHHDQCRGEKFAEFYFKCGGHAGKPGVKDADCVALDMIRTNTVNIECPLCADEKNLMVVFTCDGKDGHSLCLDCFIQYTKVALTERQFTETAQCGYSIQCPNKCDNSFVTEIHHFRLLGDELYERYQRFGTEECLLQMGGVLCPQAGCGMGMLPEDPGTRVTCPTCRFTFCRTCKNAYHRGNCNAAPVPQAQAGQGQQIDGERLRRSRWDEASEAFIRNNASIKQCPRCHVNIEKNDGCMHMTCRSCRFQFCWICLTEWSRRCQDNHWFGERN